MKRLLLASCLVLPCCLLGACEELELGDTILAEEGMVQPEGNGEPISEQEACQRIIDAEEQARFRVGCPEPDPPHLCPAYVRPAGSQTCVMYDEGSVEACERIVDHYESCEDFDTQPCIITALDEPATGCVFGVSGAGGTSGGGGAAGSAGSAGSPSAPGGAAGSSAGSPGQAGGGAGGAPPLPTAGTAGA